MSRIDTDLTETQSRALVAVEPAGADLRHVPTYSSAAFLAQLLAARADLPQTRERRRAAPDEASQRYTLAMTPLPPRSGRVLFRTM